MSLDGACDSSAIWRTDSVSPHCKKASTILQGQCCELDIQFLGLAKYSSIFRVRTRLPDFKAEWGDKQRHEFQILINCSARVATLLGGSIINLAKECHIVWSKCQVTRTSLVDSKCEVRVKFYSQQNNVTVQSMFSEINNWIYYGGYSGRLYIFYGALQVSTQTTCQADEKGTYVVSLLNRGSKSMAAPAKSPNFKFSSNFMGDNLFPNVTAGRLVGGTRHSA
ncbi:hypothetical protein K438DRAFT_1751145 [Mycena galopus ATCC 62051]|nr:hypothetical protein K438DRAFT_1751145 [Mycena galopus ATCC 62051]